MATGLPEAIKSGSDRSEVTVLSRPLTAAVFRGNPYIDEVVTWDAWWWSSGAFAKTLRPSVLRGLRTVGGQLRSRRFDVVVDLRGDLRHIIFLAAFARADTLLSFGRTGGGSLLSADVPYDLRLHMVERRARLLVPLGIAGNSIRPRIYLSEEERQVGRRNVYRTLGTTRGPRVLVDPGAKPLQQWPVENWATLCRLLTQRYGLPCLLSSGPQHALVAQNLTALAPPGRSRALNAMGIRELAATVAACDLVVSADTGIAHLAAAVGTKTVTLFGPTEPQVFRAYGCCTHTVEGHCGCRKGDLALACSTPTDTGRGACMLSIPPDHVMDAVEVILAAQ